MEANGKDTGGIADPERREGRVNCPTFDVLFEGAWVDTLPSALCAHVTHVGVLVS